MPSDYRCCDEIERIRADLLRASPRGINTQQFRSAVRMAADDRMTDDAITDLEGFHIRATAATSPGAQGNG